MARRAGARTALVLTGISTMADVALLPAGHRPDEVADSASELPFS